MNKTRDTEEGRHTHAHKVTHTISLLSKIQLMFSLSQQSVSNNIFCKRWFELYNQKSKYPDYSLGPQLPLYESRENSCVIVRSVSLSVCLGKNLFETRKHSNIPLSLIFPLKKGLSPSQSNHPRITKIENRNAA